jgi:broad specificity phosphatase PhoE
MLDGMSVRLLLIRHGRVDFDSTDFRDAPRGPQWDPPLDARGREQADLLAARLSSMRPPAAIHCSPYRRCIETITPYARAGGRTYVVDKALSEVFMGDWEGVRFEDLMARDEEAIRQRLHDQDALFDLAPGGESGADLRARVVPAIERILAPVEGGNVVVVAHGGVINAYVGHVMGVERDMFFFPENTSVTTIDVEGAERSVRFLGDTAHLAYPAIFAPPAGAFVGDADGDPGPDAPDLRRAAGSG